jgi:hypothetical protein
VVVDGAGMAVEQLAEGVGVAVAGLLPQRGVRKVRGHVHWCPELPEVLPLRGVFERVRTLHEYEG